MIFKLILAAVIGAHNTDGTKVGDQHDDQGGAKATANTTQVEYASYWGGAGSENVRAVGVDGAGNIYVIGTTTSTELGTPGALQESNRQIRRTAVSTRSCFSCDDADPETSQVRREFIGNSTGAVFVTKFAPDGRTVIYTTYFKVDQPESLAGPTIGINSAAVSPAGEVAFGLTGVFDPDLPRVNEIQSFDPSQSNLYVAKLNTTGDELVFATYLNAGSGGLAGTLRGLAIANDGSVAVTGTVAQGNNFQETNPLPGHSCQLGAQDFYDGFVALLDPTGALRFSSCFGGTTINSGAFSLEGGRAIDFGPNRLLFIAGYSAMTDFPVVNPIQSELSYDDSRDVTLSIIDPQTAELVFSSYLGPSSNRHAATGYIDGILLGNGFQQFFVYDVKADSEGNIIVVGTTNELDFPTVNAFKGNLSHPKQSYDSQHFYTFIPEQDFFVTKVNPDSGIVFSTYLGGSDSDRNFLTMALDGEDNIYVLGESRSADYPLASPIQDRLSGPSDLVISKLTPQGKLTFSSFYGGNNQSIPSTPGGIVVDGERIIIATSTDSLSFPTMNPAQAESAGAEDIGLLILSQAGQGDSDADGVTDSSDAFPADSAEYRDTDGDGVGNEADSDDDGDEVADAEDAFPLDVEEQFDSDGDGAGDNADLYDDNPFLAFDLDGDRFADFAGDTDIDGDGVPDFSDLDAFDPAVGSDFDFDGVQDSEDPDIDGDGVENSLDPSPRNREIPLQTFNGFNPLSLANRTKLPAGFFQSDQSDTGWTIAEDFGINGSWSLGSIPISDGQSAHVGFMGEFDAGTIQFSYRVDSQANRDRFTFLVDGEEQLNRSALVDWTEFSVEVSEGLHTLEWIYSKDSFGRLGDDAAWIDNLALPGITSRVAVDDISGAWYNPDQSGHGWLLEVLEGQNPESARRLNASWYVYLNGQPAWIIGSGEFNDRVVTIDAFITSGPMFPPNYNAPDLSLEPWGSITFDFSGDGFVFWNTIHPEFSSSSMNISPLFRVDSTTQGCYSGNFYDPAQNGHGFVMQVTQSGDQDVLVLSWYVYEEGRQLWLFGQAPIEDGRALVPVQQFSGPQFPPQFDPAEVVAEDWGTLDVQFTSPDNVTVDWASEDSAFGSGQIRAQRLTTVLGASCSQ